MLPARIDDGNGQERNPGMRKSVWIKIPIWTHPDVNVRLQLSVSPTGTNPIKRRKTSSLRLSPSVSDMKSCDPTNRVLAPYQERGGLDPHCRPFRLKSAVFFPRLSEHLAVTTISLNGSPSERRTLFFKFKDYEAERNGSCIKLKLLELFCDVMQEQQNMFNG